MEPPEGALGFRYTPDNPWTPPKRPDGYDELGEEMAPNARVWKKYVEETDKVDKELVEGWNKTLDVILIFAALFSAISTAFVIESSKDLKQDYTQTSAQTLYLMSQAFSAITSGSPINSSTVVAPDPDSFAPSASAVAVNTLWFLSLSLSVAVSLIAILAKDWCSFFMSGRVGPMLKQGRIRQQRWDGIERWKMKEILNVLPLLMHISLLLFAIGLSVYLWDINVQVALPVVITTSLAALFYMITVSLPLLFAFCPYTTALARFLYPHWMRLVDNTGTIECIGVTVASVAWISYRAEPLRLLARRYFYMFLTHGSKGVIGIAKGLVACVSRSVDTLNSLVRSYIDSLASHRFSELDLGSSALSPPGNSPSGFSFRERKLEVCTGVEEWTNAMRGVLSTDRSQLDGSTTPMDLVTSSMLSWMIANCEDPIAINTALQALAGASKSLPRRPLWECGAIQLVCRRVGACVASLRASAGRTQQPHNALLDDVSLYSRSHGFLTAFVKGEGLEIPDSFDAKFHLNNDKERIAGMDFAADWARMTFRYNAGFILNCFWTSLVPRYDLSAYELNNIPTQADNETWEYIENNRNQCPKQWELIQGILSGSIAKPPTAALIAMVNGITKTYLYNSLQSPAPLLRLLQGIDTEKESDWDLLQAIAIGLCVAVLSTGRFSVEQKQPGTKSLLDTDQLQRLQATQSYHSISTWEPGVSGTQKLLFFGLVCLLGDVNELGTLSTYDIRSIRTPLDYISSYSLEDSDFHSLASISPPFGFGQHMSQALSGLLQPASLQVGRGPDHEIEHELKSCLRIETLLSNSVLCHKFANEIISALIWDPTHIGSVRLSRLRLRIINDMILNVDRGNVRSDILVFLKRFMEHVKTTTSPLVLPGLEFLWTLGRKLLNLWNAYHMPPDDHANMQTFLPSLHNPFTVNTTHGGYPTNLEELGLANHWLPEIVEICRDDPAGLLDSDLLEAMIEFYQSDEQKDTKPRIELLPESIDPAWTWLEILQDLEDSCKPTVAIERLAKMNVLPAPGVETDPTSSGAHKVEQKAGPPPHLGDESEQ